jgi:predicted RNase H-like HicB family nuclease
MSTSAPKTVAVVRFELSLPVTYDEEDGWIVTTFPSIDVSSHGRTREEAERALIEATQLFIEDCFERGVLDEVLKDCGFAVTHDAPPAPSGGERLTVPLDLLAARNGSQAHTG